MILAEYGGPPEIVADFTTEALADTYVDVFNFLYELGEADESGDTKALEKLAENAYNLCNRMAGGY